MTPSLAQARENGVRTQAEITRPFTRGLGRAIAGDLDAVRPVRVLRSHRCPPAIARLVIAGRVRKSVERMSGRAFAHIREERLEAGPPIAARHAVVMLGMVRIPLRRRALAHGLPAAVCERAMVAVFDVAVRVHGFEGINLRTARARNRPS